MTKLSPEFHKLLNKNEHFSELPLDHPDVIAVQERAEMELLDMERKRDMVKQLEIRELIGGIDRTNITPIMFYYLMNNGVTSNQLSNQLKMSSYVYKEWKELNKLTPEDIYEYTIYDTINDEHIADYNQCKQVARYLDVSTNTIYQSIRTGKLVRNRYQIEKNTKLEPTLEEAMDFEVEDTMQWWLDHKSSKTSTTTTLYGKIGVRV